MQKFVNFSLAACKKAFDFLTIKRIACKPFLMSVVMRRKIVSRMLSVAVSRATPQTLFLLKPPLSSIPLHRMSSSSSPPDPPSPPSSPSPPPISRAFSRNKPNKGMYSNKNNNNNSNSSSGSSNNDNSQGNNWQEDEDLPLEEVDLMSKHFMTHSSQEDSELSVDHEELVEIYRRAVARKQADESIDKDAITGLEGMDLESVEADSLTSSSMNLPPVELYSTDPYRKVNFDISNGTYSSNELDYTNQSPNTSFLPTPTDKMNYSSNKILSRKHAQPLPAGTIHFMNLPLLRR